MRDRLCGRQTHVPFAVFCFFVYLKKKEEEAAPAEPAAPAPKPDDVVLLEEIRDLLKEKK